MDVTIKVPALVTLVVLVTGMIFFAGYAYGRADIPLDDVFPSNAACFLFDRMID